MGRYARHPSMVDVLYVGPNPRGARGGLSGSPVDAIDVARSGAAKDARLAHLSDETLMALRTELGRPLDGRDMRKIGEKCIWDDLPVMSLALSGRLREYLETKP
jgi:hypothetical protein